MRPLEGVTRRALLRGGVGAAVAWTVSGCTEDGQSRTPSAGVSPTPSQSTAVRDLLPKAQQWRASPNDIAPEVKLEAASFVEAAATWDSPPHRLGLRQRLVKAGFEPSLGPQVAGALPEAAASVAQVINAQFGGYTPTSCSVLVIFDQFVIDRTDSVRRTGSTWDVRVTKNGSVWDVTNVYPAKFPPTAASLTGPERELLENPRVALPFAARADVRSGRIATSVLHALAELSATYRLDVSVLTSGHPKYVFDTTRISDHTRGRAVDVWAFDGVPVVDRGNSPEVSRFMKAAASTGAYQVGGPSNPDGLGTQYFSDPTHQDHIHIGFTS